MLPRPVYGGVVPWAFEVLQEWSSYLYGQGYTVNTGAVADTAAVVSTLDLVVTADTAVAHLAGAIASRTVSRDRNRMR